VLYREDFESFASQHPRAGYVSCLSRETQVASVHEHAGRVQRYLATMTLMPGKDVIYLCGNPNMVDETFSALTALGFPSKDVRREKYISS
jgi:ferredoxin-NADP reductase